MSARCRMSTLLIAVAALLPCVPHPANAQKPSGSSVSAAPSAMPLVDGEVRRIDRAKGLVVLRHGDLPNLAMPAMTMGFDVADRKMLEHLNVGDKVRFQAEMVSGRATVTELKRAAPLPRRAQ